LHFLKDRGGRGNTDGTYVEAGVRDDLIGGLASIAFASENLNELARDFGPAKTANKLFALAGERGANDYLDPAPVSPNEIHAVSSSYAIGRLQSSKDQHCC